MKKDLIICIAGAGSTYTPGIIQSILSRYEQFPVSEIRLYDVSQKRNHRTYVIVEYLTQRLNQSIKLVETTDPELAFTGVDYIFSQIRAGGLKMRELDEKIPLKHGLVGQETCGVGGFAYGMRSMVQFLDLVKDCITYAPDAWILNYTNPETIISEAVRRQFPSAKIINACDMAISISKTIADIYDYDHDGWVPTYYGLNHFGWFTEVYDKNLDKDVLPEIIKRAQQEGVWLNEGDDSWKETYVNLGRMIQYFPDSIPNNYLEYYLMGDEKVAKADPSYTRANYVMDNRDNYMENFYQAILTGSKKDLEAYSMENEIHGQYITDIAISLHCDLNQRFNLIVPNKGAIPNLRSDAVVEVPAYVSAKGVEPIALRHEISDFHKGLMEAQVASEKLWVDAFFEQSYLKALQAFTLNQTVPSMLVAKKVLDDLIEANKGYWPELK
ncbi:6-phospho-alpha-glucosidase [Erysipelothrix urinaevulpis]|uniref:family 4 glycosyl hydrolase n=1 Tax=Erysipelothrix urinaevulpis TaxID=2683717 RepID=UPI001357F945|nr:6-phospho-alpha-glucosidase [Erysipelothrix urinaevulpis]